MEPSSPPDRLAARTRPARRPVLRPLDTLYYGIATLSLLGGLFFMSMSWLEPRIRWTFGIVLVLMGLYRIVHTRMRSKQRDWEEEFERLREERNRDRPTEL